MREPYTNRAPGPVPVAEHAGPVVLRQAARFLLHFLEMCAVMCIGGITLSLVVFQGAALLGYSDLPERAPGLSALLVAVNLSVPMVLWMRYRGMAWRPTLEMAGATMALGVVAVAGYALGAVAGKEVLEVVIRFACPVMLAVMLPRFRYYSARHGAHVRRGSGH